MKKPDLDLNQIAASLDKVAAKIEKKPSLLKSTRTLSIKMKYEQLTPQITKFIEQGLTYDDIGSLLNEQGIKVSAHTNRLYLSQMFGKKRTKEEKNE